MIWWPQEGRGEGIEAWRDEARVCPGSLADIYASCSICSSLHPLFLCLLALGLFCFFFLSSFSLWGVSYLFIYFRGGTLDCSVLHLPCLAVPRSSRALLYAASWSVLHHVVLCYEFFFTVVHPELCSWFALYCLKRQLFSKGAPWQK